MRWDNVGLFWQDHPVSRKRGEVIRAMPPIPETGWRPPRDYPNLKGEKVLGIDLESYDPESDDFGYGWARGKFNIVGVSVGTPDGHKWYFPIRHTVEPEMNLDPGHTLHWLSDQINSPYLQFLVGASLIYDEGGLVEEKVTTVDRLRQLKHIDVQFAEALLDETSLVRLDALEKKYLGESTKKDHVLFKWCADYYGGKPTLDQRKNIWRTPPRLTGPYAEGDAGIPLRLAPILYERLIAEDLYDIFQMECELIPLLIKMRFDGASVDVKKAEGVKTDLDARISRDQKFVDSIAGFPVNVNSGEEISRAFDKLGIKYPRTKPSKGHPNGQPSITKPYLERVQLPIAHYIREVRRFKKARDTFIDSYILKSQVNGKIHGTFHPLRGESYGTKVGRFSGSHPNLQNVPIRDEELGPKIRSIFIPDPGHKSIVKFDYSQIQYRSLVHHSVDFKDGRTGPASDAARQLYIDKPDTDYHKMVQALVELIFKVLLPRRPIKNINFGLSFGMGIAKLLFDLIHFAQSEMEKHPEIRDLLQSLATERGAREFLNAYHKAVPFAKPTIDYFMDLAGNQGYLRSILGRKGRFDLWEPSRWSNDDEHHPALPYHMALVKYGRIRRAMTHKALNRQLQMDEGDIMKASMLACWRDGLFDATGVPRLIVHDELDFSHPGTKEADEAFNLMGPLLANTVKLKVPILVERDEGENWGDVG